MLAEESNEYYQRIQNFSRVNRLAAMFYNANPKHKSMSPIDLNNDEVVSFLKALNDNGVKYILIGGFAVAFHGHIRATMDLDLWVKDEEQNLESFKKVLIKFGVPGLDKVRSFDLVPGFTQFPIGKSGFIIDPMKSLKAFSSLDFDKCYERSVEGKYEEIKFKVISREDLLKEKETTNRPKDKLDFDSLNVSTE